MTNVSRRAVLRASGALVAAWSLPGLAATGGQSAPAPEYRVGQHWKYRVKDGFRNPVEWDETHEVVAVDANGIRVRITQKGPTVDTVREEVWTKPGVVAVGAIFDAETRRFEGPFTRYDFPLQSGKSWRQNLANTDEKTGKRTKVSRRMRVGSWKSITTPAGTFDAVELKVGMNLDDGEFYRQATLCTYVSWYAPRVRNVVREERDAEYIEGSGIGAQRVRSQHAILELVETNVDPGA